MKQKKSPHPTTEGKPNPLPKGEEVNDSIIAINGTILKKLDTLEDLLKKKDDKPLTFKEACVYLGYAPSYLYKLTYRNVIPHYKPTGKMIFFSKNEIDEWIFKSNVERRVQSDDLNEEMNVEKDPNQIEMGFDEKKEKRNEEKKETEILIEFPLKSRRKTLRQAQGDKV